MEPDQLFASLPAEVLKLILHQAFDGLTVSENGKILYANPGMAKMFGLVPEEMIGRFAHEFVAPGASEQKLRESIGSGDVRHYRLTGVRKDGKTIHSEVRSYPASWDGRNLRVTAVRDITAATEAENRLRESEERFRVIIESAEEGIWQVGPDYKTVFVNPKMAALLGYTPEEMIGREASSFVTEDLHANVSDQMIARKAGLKGQYDIRYRHKNGGQVWMINSVTPLLGLDGSFQGALGCHTDITERRATEEALRESHELFESTFEQAAVGIAHTSPKGSWLRFNKRLCEVLGVTPEQLRASRITDFLSPEDGKNHENGYRGLLNGKSQLFTTEARYLIGQGEQVWLRSTGSLVRDEQEAPKYFVTICQDITAERVAEDKLAELRTQMLFSTKVSALGEIANGIAHEINNPLSVIRAYTGALREGIERLKSTGSSDAGDHFVEYTDKIDSTVTRITQIVRSLVVFTRDANREAFERIRVSTLVQDALSLCETRLRILHIELKQGPLCEEVEIECRLVLMSQVLLNLLYNAADAVESSPSKWVRISVEEEGDEVLIAVEDSGPGVPPEFRGKIMQPFYTTKPSHRGTGLGLAISRKIVESHHGSLRLDAAAEHTRFVVRLPKRQ